VRRASAIFFFFFFCFFTLPPCVPRRSPLLTDRVLCQRRVHDLAVLIRVCRTNFISLTGMEKPSRSPLSDSDLRRC